MQTYRRLSSPRRLSTMLIVSTAVLAASAGELRLESLGETVHQRYRVVRLCLLHSGPTSSTAGPPPVIYRYTSQAAPVPPTLPLNQGDNEISLLVTICPFQAEEPVMELSHLFQLTGVLRVGDSTDVAIDMALLTADAFSCAFGTCSGVCSSYVVQPGVGMVLDTNLEVVSVTYGLPADRAGIVPGLRLVEFAGHTLMGVPYRELLPLFRRSVGESVSFALVQSLGGRTVPALRQTLVYENITRRGHFASLARMGPQGVLACDTPLVTVPLLNCYARRSRTGTVLPSVYVEVGDFPCLSDQPGILSQCLRFVPLGVPPHPEPHLGIVCADGVGGPAGSPAQTYLLRLPPGEYSVVVETAHADTIESDTCTYCLQSSDTAFLPVRNCHTGATLGNPICRGESER